jgi:hypothetical protein
MSKPMRVSEKAHHILEELAAIKKTSLQQVLDEVLEEKRRELLFNTADAAYTALRNDPLAWQEEMAERKLWDNTLMDGLDTDEQWQAKEN